MELEEVEVLLVELLVVLVLEKLVDEELVDEVPQSSSSQFSIICTKVLGC